MFQAAAAVAAEQPAPLAYRYTRALDRFVYGVNAADGQRGRVTEEQTSENWTSDGWNGRTTGARGTATWSAPPSAALLTAAGDIGAVVKPYDGDYRYGDGPLARVPFAAIPADAAAAGRCSRPPSATGAGCRTQRPPALGARRRRERGHAQRGPAARDGQPHGPQRQALFGLLGTRPGAHALGQVTDATGRKGVGVALRLPDFGDELRVIIDPETSDILQSSEVMAPPPASPPRRPPARARRRGLRRVWLAERTQVFLSTGSVAALGQRP